MDTLFCGHTVGHTLWDVSPVCVWSDLNFNKLAKQIMIYYPRLGPAPKFEHFRGMPDKYYKPISRAFSQISVETRTKCIYAAVAVNHLHDVLSTQGRRDEFEGGGGVNLLEGGGQYSKNIKMWKRWGVHDPQLLWWCHPCTVYDVFSTSSVAFTCKSMFDRYSHTRTN